MIGAEAQVSIVRRIVAVNQARAEYAMIVREALDDADLRDRLSSHAFELAKRTAGERFATKAPICSVEFTRAMTGAGVCLVVRDSENRPWYVRVVVDLVNGTGRVADDERPSARAVSL